MTIKQKFSSIDQSKLTADQKAFLEKIKNVTKNFTDSEMNKKVEQPLDNFIAKAKEKMPEAIKSAPAKRTSKAKAKSSQTRKPKRTPMSLAKEIRKEGESWADARARASKMMKEDSKDLSKTVETELDKLSKLVKSQKSRAKLVGISDTDIKRDAVRKAKPRGARKVTHSGETSNQYGTYKNHLGRKYYESRDKHSDRLAPRYPKNAPLLAEGGYLTDPTFGTFQNQVFADGGKVEFVKEFTNKDGIQISEGKTENGKTFYSATVISYPLHKIIPMNEDKEYVIKRAKDIYKSMLNYKKTEDFRVYKDKKFAEGGDIDAFTLRMVKSNGIQPAEVLKEDANVKYAGGGFFSSGRPKSALMRDRKNVNHSEDYEVRYSKPRPSRSGYSGNRRFELGGSVVTDLAGHTGGSLGGDPSLLSGTSGTAYTGLVGETGAMSSGEMFEAGGTLPSGASQSYMVTEAFGNPAQHYANGGGLPAGAEQSYINYYLGEGSAQGIYSKGGSVKNERKHVNHEEDYEVRYAKSRPSRKGYKGVRGFATGGSVTNERKHVNHNEDYEVRYAKPRPSRKGYKGKRSFAGGGGIGETPKIYVADLEAYNNGRLSGVWLDLADYNNADELMEAIQDFLKTSGGEEYAIHDVEYIPSSMYSEYMGQRDFEELYEMIDLAKDNNLPLSVVQEVVSQYDANAVDEFQGRYDSAEDFAEQLVDEMGGLENFSSPEYYVDITDTDRRLLAGDMADSYVDDIRDEDGGNRVIEEAGLDLDEYEEADSERQEEMLDEAVEIVREEYYDNWYEGLSDPYEFLVEEQGMYSPEDLFNASFIGIDYEKLARDLEQDYTFIYEDGELYVFNIR